MRISGTHSIPAIDLAPLFDAGSDDMAEVAHQIYDTYSKVGFAYIINHGISPDLVEDVFASSRRFHDLRIEDKMRIEINRHHRGYIPINTSTDRTSVIKKAARPNQSESFMMMHELEPDDPDIVAGAPLAGPNQWPKSLGGFREAVTRYHDALVLLSKRLVGVFELSLQTDKLAHHFERPTTWLRLLHYPSLPPEAPADLFGSNPHTDYGFITILAQDEVGGLQVRKLNGDWIDVPHVRGSLVLNIGEVLRHWSNGKFVATPHRVINRSGRERYSCPFFFDPNIHSSISTLSSCVGNDYPNKFTDVVYGELAMEHLRSNHAQHTEAQ
jgi:isopenicillin N synthase-like dioxygenase